MVRNPGPPQLQPPPRAGKSPLGKRNDRNRRSERPRNLGVAVLFAVLAVALIGVFAVLPRWAETRRAATMVEATPTTLSVNEEQSRAPAPEATAVRPPGPPPTPTPPPTRTEKTEDAVGTSHRSPPPIDGEFADLMSRGLTALGRGQWEAAKKNFEAASRLRPDAPEAADGLARVASAERRDLVMAGIDRGREFEEAERWAEAEQAYAQVLAVDPEAAHALAGKERAALRASLDEQLEYHLENPGRFSSPSVFDDATGVLGEAREVTPSGPRLSAQVERLEKLLEAASTPVEVVLESDNATDVVVYRVGRIGTFTRRQLELRPGTYTAVGSRDGYRAVSYTHLRAHET